MRAVLLLAALAALLAAVPAQARGDSGAGAAWARAPLAGRCAVLGLRACGCQGARGGGRLGAGRGQRRPPPLHRCCCPAGSTPFAGWPAAACTTAGRRRHIHIHSPLFLQGQAYCPPYAATYTTAAQCDAAILSGVQAAEALGIELAKHGINAGQNSTSESAMLTSECAGAAAVAMVCKAVQCRGGLVVAPADPPPCCPSNRCLLQLMARQWWSTTTAWRRCAVLLWLATASVQLAGRSGQAEGRRQEGRSRQERWAGRICPCTDPRRCSHPAPIATRAQAGRQLLLRPQGGGGRRCGGPQSAPPGGDHERRPRPAPLGKERLGAGAGGCREYCLPGQPCASGRRCHVPWPNPDPLPSAARCCRPWRLRSWPALQHWRPSRAATSVVA